MIVVMVINNLAYFDLVYFIIVLTWFIPCWVFIVLGWQLFTYNNILFMDDDSATIEFFWTVVPASAVTVLCFLNLQFISGDAAYGDGKLFEVVGRQWYWSYSDRVTGFYDSMILDYVGSVGKPVRFEYGVPYKLIVTSSDVIHSFSIPDYHVKVDAIPGRVNYGMFYPDRIGVFVGYCSELCGAGHAYMPIVVEIALGKDRWRRKRL